MSALVHVVDDEPEIRRLVKDALQLDGHDVETYADGPAFLSDLDKAQPDIVFVDLKMPQMDGWTVAEQVRERTDPAPPLLAITAFFGSKIRSSSELEPHFDGVLGKPFGLDELNEVVREHLG